MKLKETQRNWSTERVHVPGRAPPVYNNSLFLFPIKTFIPWRWCVTFVLAKLLTISWVSRVKGNGPCYAIGIVLDSWKEGNPYNSKDSETEPKKKNGLIIPRTWGTCVCFKPLSQWNQNKRRERKQNEFFEMIQTKRCVCDDVCQIWSCQKSAALPGPLNTKVAAAVRPFFFLLLLLPFGQTSRMRDKRRERRLETCWPAPTQQQPYLKGLFLSGDRAARCKELHVISFFF